MAKRKRLGPAALTGGEDASGGGSNPPTVTAPPIAQVAGAAAAEAAIRDLSDEMGRARAEGRMVQDIAPADIAEDHLNRDRVGVSRADQEALEASIAARGLQMPIELVDLGPEAEGKRYGLISGWRRLQAIKRLKERTGEARYDWIAAILRQPKGAGDAYLSMVEENELRVGLSYYERAQVAARAAQAGVFESTPDAVQALFPTASKAKWSKINAFVRIFWVLGEELHFPETIPERLGLRLSRALDDGHGAALYDGLRRADRPEDPAAEQALLERLLTKVTGKTAPHKVPRARFVTGDGAIEVDRSPKGMRLSGPGVTKTLMKDLELWLSKRQ